MLDWLQGWLGYFTNLYELIICAVKQGLCQLQTWAFEVAEERIIDPLLGWLPAPPVWVIMWLAPYYHTLNYFLPVGETLTVVGVASTFWLTVFSVRFLWRFVGFLFGR